MHCEILRGFCLGDGVDVTPGQVVEIAAHRAALLIQQGKVRLAQTPTAPDLDDTLTKPKRKPKNA